MTTTAPSYHANPDRTPIVLLHGLTASWRAWRPVREHLPATGVHVASLPGHRDGPPMPDGVRPTIDVIVDGVCAQLDAAGIERAHMIGNSLGGWVAIELARRGRAASVVALSPAGAWTNDADVRRLTRLFSLGDRMSRSGLARRLARTGPGRRLLFGSVMARPQVLTSADAEDMFTDMAACTMMMDLVGGVTDFGPVKPFQTLPCPVTVVWGSRDKTIPFPRYGLPMMAALPGADLVRVPAVGHVPMGDDPTRIAAIILEAVRRVGGAAHSQGSSS